jgi:hypothetical protein
MYNGFGILILQMCVCFCCWAPLFGVEHRTIEQVESEFATGLKDPENIPIQVEHTRGLFTGETVLRGGSGEVNLPLPILNNRNEEINRWESDFIVWGLPKYSLFYVP